MLFHSIVFSALWYFFGVATEKNTIPPTPASDFAFLPGFYLVVSFVPLVCLTIRRLHDIGRRGWWVLLLVLMYFTMYSALGYARSFPPEITFMTVAYASIFVGGCLSGFLVLFGFCTEPGQNGENAYGSDPRPLPRTSKPL
jgi:uncharacterized membrane protein YhaH (DUF805 family)